MKNFIAAWYCVLLCAWLPAGASAQGTAATAPTRYVEISGNRIAYRTIGKGSPLLLVNRMRGTLDTWDPLFLDQLARSHRVITVDYPGVGYSTGTLAPDMGLAARFVRDFADSIKLDRFALLGWSWGGAVAQVLLLDEPQRVTHAVLVGTNPPGNNAAPTQKVWLDRALKPINDLADEEILFFEPRSRTSVQAAKASHDRIYARPGVTPRIPSTMDQFMVYIQASAGYRQDVPNRRGALTRSPVPMLILCGDNDPSVPAANWYPLVGAIPRGQIVVLPESGHGPQHQYPKLSARYITGFIANTDD